MIDKLSPLSYNGTYHLYNRAVGNEKLFLSDSDYRHFLKKYELYISPIAETYAYCLLPNHFHFLLRIKDENEIDLRKPNLTGRTTGRTRPVRLNSADPNQSFSNFFNSYAKSFNKVHDRVGNLFNRPFKRIHIDSESYFTLLVYYIHRNPIHHGYVHNFTNWEYSSYRTFLSDKRTHLKGEEVLTWFRGRNEFINFHQDNLDFSDDFQTYLLE